MNDLTPARYERTDASPFGVTLSALGLALGIALTLLASAWLYLSHAHVAPRSPLAEKASSFRNGATAQTSVVKDWIEQDRLVRAHLHSYGWVDREAGIVRIPIERAMTRLVDEASSTHAKENP